MSILATVILLATDGSEDSEVAARTAVELSRRLDSELHVVYVAPEHPYRHAHHDFHNREEVDQFRREDQRVLNEHADLVREVGGTVAGTHLRVGQVAKEIVELAEELGAGLVVVGGRGHSRIRRALMGSVSDSIVTHAHCSVLIVRTYGEEEERGYLPGKILVAFDGSKSSSEAARVAREISQATDSELHLVYAMQEERYRPHLGPEMWEGWEEGFERAKRHAHSWLEGEAKRMRDEEAKSVEAHVVLGRPDAGIVWLAQELDTGLLVVGSRGHRGIRRALIGSVSDEAGRRELLGGGVVGRNAPLTSALIVTVAANLMLAALLALGMIGQDMPAVGSISFGLAFATAGCVFAAVAALVAQLTEGAGVARGIAISVLVLAFLLRVAGDVGGDESRLSWLSWVSPIGWVQRVRPFADERWWVFALAAGAFIVLAAAAYALSSQRDVGAGFLPPQSGPATASPSLRSPLALAWRLHRGLLLGWTVGFAAMGVVFGSVTEAASDILNDNPQLETLFERVGGQAGVADAYLSAIMGILGLVASGYAIQATLRLRFEETDMRAEPVLATAVGRLRWATSHLLFAVVGPAVTLATAGLAAGLTYGLSTGDGGEELPRVLASAIVQLPAVWVLAGIAAALFGMLPRLTTLSWVALGAFVLLGLFGQLLQLDQWLLDISPFTHIPKLPGGEVSAEPLVWLVSVTAVLTIAGLVGLRRRNLG